MPVASSCSIAGASRNVCRQYTEMTRRRITFEYALIKDGVDRSGGGCTEAVCPA